MIRLKIKDSYFQIIDGYNVNKSSREVKFSSLKIDFTDKTIADLPLKYQEVQLLDLDENYNVSEVIYTGYVNNFVLPKMKNRQEFRELELDLLSPLAMATLRTVDAVGTYTLQPLIREIIQPLIDDGFVLKELNVGNNQITVNYIMETVESALNKLSNKHNFWWYIDENKNIYINSIAYLLAKNPVFDYNDENKIDGLINVIPSINATDYCNTIDFTNVRVYTSSYYNKSYEYNPETGELDIPVYEFFYPLVKKDSFNTGDEITFENPIDIDKNNILKCYNNASSNIYVPKSALKIDKIVGSTVSNVLNIYLDSNNDLIIPSNVLIQDSYSDEAEWVLVRDPFFKNLIVGLKYNGQPFDVYQIASISSLVWAKIRVSDNVEVEKNKNIISRSGIVEKQINMNEQWKLYDELLTIANSYIKKNVSKVEQVIFDIDKENNFSIGDTIRINKPSFLIDDVYIITDSSENYSGNVRTWRFTLKNTNILENFVDLFRASEKQETSDVNYNLITSDYIEEGFQETYEVVEK